jgi:hexosaminidase
VLYINIELFVLDEPYDYVDPLLTNEAYEIFISEQGEVTLRCAGYVSFVRAITEFGHLILPDGTLTKLPLYISDFPSYSWRALMLDVSTNFIPIYTIKWLIDGMFVSKLNVLQLHLSDAQSFPYELIQFPEVTKQGAYSTYEMYTREDLVDLIIYA